MVQRLLYHVRVEWTALAYKIMLAVVVGCVVALIMKWSELRAARAAQARAARRITPEPRRHLDKAA